jgi:hypothetical protein
VKGSEGQGGKSGRTVKVTYGLWGEVKVMLKLVCNTCGVTILETRCSTFFPFVAFLTFIAANCSWSFVYWVIILSVFLLFHVYCFTACVLLSYIL